MKKRKAYSELTLLKCSQTIYPDSPDKARLEAFTNPRPGRRYRITFDCPEFTSLCPITGQPDFGHIQIEYIPKQQCLESKSLKLYLFSFRNHHAFHEDVTNRILDDIVRLIRPHQARVTGHFNARGGIALNVVAEYPDQPTGLGKTNSSKKLRA